MAFKKGQSGNPAGRPEKTKVVTQMLTSALNEAYGRGDKTKMRAVIDAWVKAAIDGELPAIIAIADRIEGKPAQESTVTIHRSAAELTDQEIAARIAELRGAGASHGDGASPLDPSKLN